MMAPPTAEVRQVADVQTSPGFAAQGGGNPVFGEHYFLHLVGPLALAGHGGTRSCYRELDRSQFPWGRGAYWKGQFFWLQPFRSVAVDPAIVAIGSVVYVPDLAGYPLPDGTLSNGCVRAEDTGIAIQGRHLDWFVGQPPDGSWLRTRPPPRQVTVFADSRRCTKAFP